MTEGAWRNAGRVHKLGHNNDFPRKEKGRVRVRVMGEIKDSIKQGIFKITCMMLTFYMYISTKETHDSNLIKILG